MAAGGHFSLTQYYYYCCYFVAASPLQYTLRQISASIETRSFFIPSPFLRASPLTLDVVVSIFFFHKFRLCMFSNAITISNCAHVLRSIPLH